MTAPLFCNTTTFLTASKPSTLSSLLLLLPLSASSLRYAYGKDPSQPGQLKVHLGQVPVDGDYWVVGLGPDSFGPDGAYEWALVSGP